LLAPAIEMNANKLVSASSVTGDPVTNRDGEHLGKIEDIVLDLSSGRVAYAVLSFGGFLGIGDKLFAVPWGAMKLDSDRKRFILDVQKETLQKGRGLRQGRLAGPRGSRARHAHPLAVQGAALLELKS
jgi:sporulation protein YlmC with PRC-barrel domain